MLAKSRILGKAVRPAGGKFSLSTSNFRATQWVVYAPARPIGQWPASFRCQRRTLDRNPALSNASFLCRKKRFSEANETPSTGSAAGGTVIAARTNRGFPDSGWRESPVHHRRSR
jgi:hypothetical protein